MVNNALYGFGPEDDFDYEEDAEGGDAPAAEDD
jgi:hypothetical protein